MTAHDLARFVEAQAGGVWDRALAEVRRGRKESHWMWFVFPQLAGLGRSSTARFYALADGEEAGAVLAHPLLGSRLRTITEALLEGGGGDPVAIFGEIDALKLRSSLTLFDAVAGPDDPFGRALARFFEESDLTTLHLLSKGFNRTG